MTTTAPDRQSLKDAGRYYVARRRRIPPGTPCARSGCPNPIPETAYANAQYCGAPCRIKAFRARHVDN